MLLTFRLRPSHAHWENTDVGQLKATMAGKIALKFMTDFKTTDILCRSVTSFLYTSLAPLLPSVFCCRRHYDLGVDGLSLGSQGISFTPCWCSFLEHQNSSQAAMPTEIMYARAETRCRMEDTFCHTCSTAAAVTCSGT